MRARHAVLLTPSISLRLNQALSCTQIMRETPQIPFYVFNSLRTLLTIQRRTVILRNAVTKDPPALAAHYLPAKSFGMRSYENSRVVLVSLTKFLRPYSNFSGSPTRLPAPGGLVGRGGYLTKSRTYNFLAPFSSIPFSFFILRTLLRFLALSENSTLLFSGDSALFAQNTRAGVGGNIGTSN